MVEKSKGEPTFEAAAPAKNYDEKHWIVLDDSDNIPPTGQPIGINGKFWILKPGIPAQVPLNILEVLDHAVTLVPQKNPQTNQIVGWRKRLRYPYHRASEEERREVMTPASQA
jgi:hypothetical protein